MEKISAKERKAAWERIDKGGEFIKKNWHKSCYYGMTSVEIVKYIREKQTVPRQTEENKK